MIDTNFSIRLGEYSYLPPTKTHIIYTYPRMRTYVDKCNDFIAYIAKMLDVVT